MSFRTTLPQTQNGPTHMSLQDHPVYFYMGTHLQNVITSIGNTTFVRNGVVVLAESSYGNSHPATALVGSDMANSPMTGSARSTPIQQVFTPYGYNRQTAPPPTSTGFTGQPRTSAAPMYLMGNGYRAYLTILMRLCSPDSLSPFAAGGINAYAYCSNDPINYSDNSGRARIKNTKRPNSPSSLRTINNQSRGILRQNSKFDFEFDFVEELMTRKPSATDTILDTAGRLDPTAVPELTAKQIDRVFNPRVRHPYISHTPSKPFTHIDASAMREWYEKSRSQLTPNELNTWLAARTLDLKPEALLKSVGILPTRARILNSNLLQRASMLRETQ